MGSELPGQAPAVIGRQRLVPGAHRAERIGPAPLGDEALGAADHVERDRLASVGRVGPGRQPVAPQHHAPQAGIVGRQRCDLQAQLEAGSAPRHPRHLAAEALLGQRLAIHRRRQGDHRVGMQVIHVARIHQRVHRGVDRRRCAAGPPATVIERGHHLVLVIDAAVHGLQGAHTVEPQGRQAVGSKRAEVATRALHVQHLAGLAGHGIGDRGLARRVAAPVVRHPRVGPEHMGALDEHIDLGWHHRGVTHGRWNTSSSSSII